MSKKVTVNFENISIEIPAEIAADDQSIKDVLSVHYPGVANSKIVRNESGISIIKQAGKKGASVGEIVTRLERVPTYKEPDWVADLDTPLTIERVEDIDFGLQLELLLQKQRTIASVVAALSTKSSKTIGLIQ